MDTLVNLTLIFIRKPLGPLVGLESPNSHPFLFLVIFGPAISVCNCRAKIFLIVIVFAYLVYYIVY